MTSESFGIAFGKIIEELFTSLSDFRRLAEGRPAIRAVG